MKTAAGNSDKPVDNQDWKKKYFDSLGSLENEQRQFRAMEAVLKRLNSRLCIASLGQSPQLDDELKRLQAAMRRDSSSDELDKIAAALTDIIQTLDRSNPAQVAPVPEAKAPKAESTNPIDAPAGDKQGLDPRASIAGDEQIRAVLAALLAELRRDPQLIIHVDELDGRLAKSMTREQLPDVLSSLTELVGRRIQRIERDKQEVETLLSQMVGKLDEIGQFVVAQNQSQTQAHASSETLNIQLAGEMRAMGESVDAASDLGQVRLQVRSRLDSIGRHLQEFRERETALAAEMRASNEQMQARVTALEAEASRLHNQLKDEQRLSTIDALTNVPNRLAYEKRMAEELQRWQRFKQPTCIAVWDVDRFKHINDTYGHRSGDRVLRAVAECLAGRIRSTDFLARYGGEEFVMILAGTQLGDAVRIVDEMRVAVSNLKMHFKGTPLAITISCGLTGLLPNDSMEAAFERADKLLYKAKENGRNRCING